MFTRLVLPVSLITSVFRNADKYSTSPRPSGYTGVILVKYIIITQYSVYTMAHSGILQRCHITMRNVILRITIKFFQDIIIIIIIIIINADDSVSTMMINNSIAYVIQTNVIYLFFITSPILSKVK